MNNYSIEFETIFDNDIFVCRCVCLFPQGVPAGVEICVYDGRKCIGTVKLWRKQLPKESVVINAVLSRSNNNVVELLEEAKYKFLKLNLIRRLLSESI